MKSRCTEGFTKPPAHFTEDTLLSAMEKAGASDMADDVERKGLGTPATRADIIEKLIKDSYVKREKKQLIPTDDGLKLITVMPEKVKSPKLTAEWENALAKVAKGEISPEEFMEGIREMVGDLISTYHEVSDEERTMFGVMSRKKLGKSLVTMRELLKSSILSNAATIIMLHSHPSYRIEKPVPSKEDNMTTLNVMMATDLMGINLQDHVIVAGGSGSIYSYRTELKDKFSIEGLQNIIERSADKRILAEPSADYKPLAKVEELEEQNYNQIDNVLNNMPNKDKGKTEKEKPAAKQERYKPLPKDKRPSLLEQMDVMKAELDARNVERAISRNKARVERMV